MHLLTDIELRSHWLKDRAEELWVAEDTRLTPAAEDFIREHGIILRRKPILAMPEKESEAGMGVPEKKEHMTHLYGHQMVSKTDPRIAFRGAMDSLRASTICLQVTAEEQKESGIRQDLAELLRYETKILLAEVTRRELGAICVFGMNSEELRRASHDPKGSCGLPGHPSPDASMGRVAAELNLLRTRAREAELLCVSAYGPEGAEIREDLCAAMNRLSSCIYLVFCRCAGGVYDRKKV